ncbi:uncharacterized protein MONBRDRAFT_23416 [Monosiga brevicollis MX1]|uniref:Uncharacterized protein n=1 Tax=Monosiga brevicollis TaxID=81824 RepID=A9UTC2_MONBE|nr:uncharacterized protein MONBRDRAFT_23416 [Monosiga brevicollis MX1]EDQ91222.1 predicted protein [Monosiga brevicollis MX1]|eukprot:XP_001743644.1 hypothetical protein [Monosiga brevicollis MX1]
MAETTAPVQYPWQTARSDIEQCEAIETRRAELQVLLAAEDNGDATLTAHIQEWNTLTQARSVLNAKLLEQENLRLKHEAVLDLFHICNDILKSHVEFDQTEAALLHCIRESHQMASAYCVKHQLDQSREPSSTNPSSENSAVAPPATIPAPPPPPAMSAPPPPPPPGPPPSFAAPEPTEKRPKRETAPSLPTTSQLPKPSAEGFKSPLALRTPLKPVNNAYLADVAKSGKSILRRTDFPRSPGGTPCRQRRRLSTADGADLVLLALRRKFANVNGDSPGGSPLASPLASPFATTPSAQPKREYTPHINCSHLAHRVLLLLWSPHPGSPACDAVALASPL